MPLSKIQTSGITNDAIGADQLADNAVVTASITSGAISTAKVADGAITQVKTTGVGAHGNAFINGAMQVAQRATSSTGLGAANGYFTVDRQRLVFGSTSGRLTSSQSSDAPAGFANSLKFECTTADTSIGAGEYVFVQQKIEGQHLQHFAKGTSSAKAFAISFYVKGNAAATYAFEMYDGDNNRQISKLFNVTTSWNRIELIFPADTTGAFDDDNGGSLSPSIWLHSGSNYNSGTLESAWATNTNANRAAGISSFFDSTNRTFFFTGLKLEPVQVTDYVHRSFAEELQLCQRYFEKSYNTGTAPASNTSAGLITTDTMGGDTTTAYLTHQLEYRVSKRSAPTVVIYDQAEATGKVTSHVTGVSTANGQTVTTEHAGDKSISMNRPSGTAANGFRFHYTADAEL